MNFRRSLAEIHVCPRFAWQDAPRRSSAVHLGSCKLIGWKEKDLPVRRYPCLYSLSRLCKAALLALIALYCASGQETAAPKEGALNTYLTREPTDTTGQLALMQQGLYQEQVDTNVVMFLLQYGSRIHMDRTYYPANTSDREMVPCYVFTPANMPRGARRPGLVMVHGGFHEKLDWRFFKLIDDAVGHGYAVIFPEYRGS